MTGAEITAILTGVALFGAALRGTPAIWRFVVAMARLPHMTEQIWSEFGRNGGSTTRDRIEHIARDVAELARSTTASAEALAAHEARLTIVERSVVRLSVIVGGDEGEQ